MATLTVTERGQVTFRKEVLQHLGIKPVARAPGEQSVRRIAGQEDLRNTGRLPIRTGEHYRPDQPFHVPATLDEADRQPVQQIGVTRHASL